MSDSGSKIVRTTTWSAGPGCHGGCGVLAHLRDGKLVKIQIATDITDRKMLESEREKLIAELNSALEEVRTLQGILPICSFCKNIRNDEGYYEQIESYIHKHTGADFSHTICQPCMKKHYPEEYESITK